MSKKMKNCKTCGTEIAASAKICPKCGAKNKKSHPILIGIIVVFVLFAAIGSTGSDSTQINNTDTAVTTPEVIEYQVYTVHEMVDTLEKNAMKAEATYDNQYVEITGRINVIDSDGDYISIVSTKDKYAFIGVQCYIMNDEQTNILMDMSTNDIITVRGKITAVGEVLGYQLDINEIITK